MADYKESWKIVRENKSSQRPHIRMYKAAAQQPLLGWIFHQKSEIPYLSGYYLIRHCTGTDIMLTQKTDSWYVKDLRTIVLLDSESTHTYKHIRREAMRADIDHRQISPEKYIREQRSAMEHGINQRLLFDYQ